MLGITDIYQRMINEIKNQVSKKPARHHNSQNVNLYSANVDILGVYRRLQLIFGGNWRKCPTSTEYKQRDYTETTYFSSQIRASYHDNEFSKSKASASCWCFFSGISSR